MDEENNSAVESAGKDAEERKQKKQGGPGKGKQAAKKLAKDGATKLIKFLSKAGALFPVILIALIVILLIGLIGFFLTMPGLFLENIKNTAKNFFTAIQGWFVSNEVSSQISKEDELELAQRIHNMGYDISGMGFANVEEYNDENTPVKIGKNVEGKNYLRQYLIANEATYTLAEWSWGSAFSAVFDEDTAMDYAEGMLVINGKGLLQSIKVDRENEQLVIETAPHWWNIFVGGKNKFYFGLSDWTARYGKPVELLLSLHLATMMPDLSYDIASKDEFNTKVNIDLHEATISWDVKYGELTEEDILAINSVVQAKEEKKKEHEKHIANNIQNCGCEDYEITEADLKGLTLEQLDGLIELINDGNKENKTSYPRITSVTKHWYYNDIYFQYSGDNATVRKEMTYIPQSEDDSLKDIADRITLEATITGDSTYQLCEPEVSGPNPEIIDLFKNGKYYKYDGNRGTARKIENAKANDLGKTKYSFDGLEYQVEEKTVEKEPVSFYTEKTMSDGTVVKSKENAMTAFTILEGMHSDAAEKIYRNLQELLIYLGYFSESDFATPSTQVLEWILPKHTPPVWAIRETNEYGAFIKSQANLEGGFASGENVIAPADATVEGVGTNSIKLKLKAVDSATVQAIKEKLGKDKNIEIDGNCILDMEFFIQGINASVSQGQEIKRGDTIGTTSEENIHIIMYNKDKSIVDNIEDYMQPTYKGINDGDSWYDPDYDLGDIDEIEITVYNKLREYGLTKEGACAIMGVIRAESGFDPYAENPTDGGFGLLQWTHGRRTNLETWCSNNGYDYRTEEGQMAFFIYELQGSYSQANGYRFPVYETLMSSTNLEECLTMFFCHAEAGYDVEITTEGEYAQGTGSTKQLYDTRLTYATAYMNEMPN